MNKETIDQHCISSLTGPKLHLAGYHFTNQVQIQVTMVSRTLTKSTLGAKKIIFTACHLGRLKVAFTSQLRHHYFQLALKAFRQAEFISHFFCFSSSSKNISCPLGKLKTDFTNPIVKSTSPGLSDTTFFARWKSYLCMCLVDASLTWQCRI